MLPSMCGAHYCMGCKVAVSTRFSVAGPMFLNALVGPTYVRGAA
jgi:gamma-glutamyl phosphate reductase